MATVTQPLRDEHAHLLSHVKALRAVADLVGEVPMEALRQEVDDAYRFLTEHLLPHAEAEERVLYPAVAEAMGAPEATRTMSRDHAEIGRLIQELGEIRAGLAEAELDPVRARALRRVLYGLYTLVMVHFAKEEEVYLPLLDRRLTPEQASELLAAAAEAAHGP